LVKGTLPTLGGRWGRRKSLVKEKLKSRNESLRGIGFIADGCGRDVEIIRRRKRGTQFLEKYALGGKILDRGTVSYKGAR